MLHGIQKLHNDIRYPEFAKSNNAVVSVFYTFPFFSIFLLSILQNTIINKFSFGFHLYTENRTITTSNPSYEIRYVWISNLLMLLLPTIFFLVSILISTHLIKRNQVNTTSSESSISKHSDVLIVIWFFILISLMHRLHL